MLKVSYFSGRTEHGINVIPLFGKADTELEKCASVLLPDVVKYIDNLRPRKDAQYVLVNAMGASEWWGDNINHDAFTEASLIHVPDKWTGNPLLDRISSKNWSYGFPTFYNAHAFGHHKNKNNDQAYGDVELATWNPRMKRVELVIRIDKDKCERFGGIGVWDRLNTLQYIDCSMGCKVPYDACSYCLDWDLYQQALATFDPKKDMHPGQAVLRFHKAKKAKDKIGIRGVSITRQDYCQDMRLHAGQIYPDGRKVFVYNDFPRFFDISFVFIGADKTAKVMLFIFSNGKLHPKSSAEMAEQLGVSDPDEKIASIDEEILKSAFGKLAKPKIGEIDKDVVPSQFAGKAIPLLTNQESDIPNETLDSLSNLPLKNILSTTAGMGIVLKPREFQRITIIQSGDKSLADELDRKNIVFPQTDSEEQVEMGSKYFLPALMKLLLPFLALRSAFGPMIEQRAIMLPSQSSEKINKTASHTSPLLAKIGAAYTNYRRNVMDIVVHSQNLINMDDNSELSKLASTQVEDLFTPLSISYLQNAYRERFGDISGAMVQR